MTLDVQIVSYAEALSRHEPAWNAICDAMGANPSLRPAWQSLTLQAHHRVDDAKVILFLDQDRLVGVLPVIPTTRRLRGMPTRLLESTSNLLSYHAGLAITPGRTADVFDSLREAGRSMRWDALWIANVDQASSTAAAIDDYAKTNGLPLLRRPGESSPYVVVDCSWKTFLERRTKKFRANITRYTKRLAAAGEGATRWVEPGEPMEPLLAAMLEIEDASWKKQAGVAITDRREEVRYHELLLGYLSATGKLLANVLWLNGRPVAYVLCARHEGWVGQLKTSCRLDVADAGSIAVAESVRRSFELGAKEYDFLGKADRHKLVWTDEIRHHADLILCNRTFGGRWLAMTEVALTRLADLRRPRAAEPDKAD